MAHSSRIGELITASDNPLMHRVIVNRLWHYHFGVGIVETPSDFDLAVDSQSSGVTRMACCDVKEKQILAEVHSSIDLHE